MDKYKRCEFYQEFNPKDFKNDVWVLITTMQEISYKLYGHEGKLNLFDIVICPLKSNAELHSFKSSYVKFNQMLTHNLK